MDPKILLADPFWLRKITENLHNVAHVSIGCSVDRYAKLKVCISELLMHASNLTNNKLHGMTTIILTVVRFVGTGCFLEVRILTVIRNEHNTNSRCSAVIFTKTPHSKLAVTELNPRSQREPVADSLEPTETTGQYHIRKLLQN